LERCLIFTKWSSSTAAGKKARRSLPDGFLGIERSLFYRNGTGSRE
jgi:hypothetical protein